MSAGPAFDPRLTPAREDLAFEGLRGRIDAPRYVEGEIKQVAVPVAPLRRRPASDAPLDTQALYGEEARVLDEDWEGWAWVQLQADGYVGYMPAEALAPLGPAPTHKVKAQLAFLFPGPDIKLPPRETLPFGSKVSVRAESGLFRATAEGFFHQAHLAPRDDMEDDPVAVAARFLGVPYLWGGRSSLGLDCSGLVQTALTACGLPCPRDSDMQEAALGAPLDLAGPFRRGDLLFWPGHVALVETPDILLHANAFHMAVAREPLQPALARIAAAGSPLRSARRLGPG